MSKIQYKLTRDANNKVVDQNNNSELSHGFNPNQPRDENGRWVKVFGFLGDMVKAKPRVDYSQKSTKELKEQLSRQKTIKQLDEMESEDSDDTLDKMLKGSISINQELQKINVKPGTTKRQQYPDMSNEELQKRITRLNLEQRYSDLVGDTKYVKSGGEKFREVLQTTGAILSIAFVVKNIIKK